MLDHTPLPRDVMASFSSSYSALFAVLNAEVQIRWLQMVVRNSFYPELPRVRAFLHKHSRLTPGCRGGPCEVRAESSTQRRLHPSLRRSLQQMLFQNGLVPTNQSCPPLPVSPASPPGPHSPPCRPQQRPAWLYWTSTSLREVSGGALPRVDLGWDWLRRGRLRLLSTCNTWGAGPAETGFNRARTGSSQKQTSRTLRTGPQNFRCWCRPLSSTLLQTVKASPDEKTLIHRSSEVGSSFYSYFERMFFSFLLQPRLQEVCTCT
ncbi:hypothetical protein OJAV_G00134920 [Oryzias javanicus]|uniref:Peptidase M1 leukotriene A4 hydrolase/aminopeptidase C-terminal domain-containing protein n=1 Tax=Oryzias javanicus TaxID=123683 RepID=A0A437CTS2_ORYJA|nr:hypothetical protein OJAV_G00134920 [Oryzias javanicus]